MSKNKGFSLPEVVLVVAVLSILTTLVYPYFAQYINAQKEQDEQRIQLEIVRAVDAYVKDKGVFPQTTTLTAFAEDISPYSNLLPNEIETDKWGKRRYIKHLKHVREYREVSVDTNYMFVLSLGEGVGLNGCFGEGLTKECDPTVFEPVIDASLTTVADFQNLSAPDGDILTAYSDVSLKMGWYTKTRQRLEAISGALKEYATVQRYEGIVNGKSNMGIYFPPSSEEYAASQPLYLISDEAKNEILEELGNATVRQTPDDVRYKDMKGLMRLIGLPESYCCTPLFRVTVKGESVERPFYYYSNPRPRINETECHAAPTTLSSYKLPAKITVKKISCHVL